MQNWPNVAGRALVLIWLCGQGPGECEEVAAEQRRIVPVNDTEVLALIVKRFKCYTQEELSDTLKRIAKVEETRMLGGLAFALRDESYRRCALVFMLKEKLRDERLAPYLAECMASVKERSKDILLLAVKLANVIRSEALIAPLLEHAVGSDYVQEEWSPTGGPDEHMDITLVSVFAVAANALYSCSGGEIGLQGRRAPKAVRGAEKEKLIAKW